MRRRNDHPTCTEQRQRRLPDEHLQILLLWEPIGGAPS
jgi:hypothetical protein